MGEEGNNVIVAIKSVTVLYMVRTKKERKCIYALFICIKWLRWIQTKKKIKGIQWVHTPSFFFANYLML